MKRNDRILIIGIVMVAIVFFIIGRTFVSDEKGKEAVIMVDGKEYGRYSLTKEVRVSIADKNTLVIQNGKADMVLANCPDQICVHQKEIDKKGETIVCLPNKIIIQIDGKAEDKEIDAIAN